MGSPRSVAHSSVDQFEEQFREPSLRASVLTPSGTYTGLDPHSRLSVLISSAWLRRTGQGA